MQKSLTIIFMLLLSAVQSSACSIPVFRYALERWQPSPFELLIFHRGPLDEKCKTVSKEIERLIVGANIELVDVDLSGRVDKESLAVADKYIKDKAGPWVVVRFPDSDLKTPLAWSGPLDESAIGALIASPSRELIARQLFCGRSALFLMLDSTDAKANAAATDMLDDALRKMETTIQLPAATAEGPQLRSELPVRVSFGALHLSRNTPGEEAFINMLLACEPGLTEVKGPLIFAIYGRGRVLSVLHGKDLKASEVESTARFLCGACSCQVKELNPGVDLIFKTRWDDFLDIEILPPPRQVKTNSIRDH